MTNAIATFGQVLTAMVTPFAADGSNLDGAVKLAKYLTTEGGNDGSSSMEPPVRARPSPRMSRSP